MSPSFLYTIKVLRLFLNPYSTGPTLLSAVTLHSFQVTDSSCLVPEVPFLTLVHSFSVHIFRYTLQFSIHFTVPSNSEFTGKNHKACTKIFGQIPFTLVAGSEQTPQD